jgi:Bacterial regulatory proteins, lacI family
MSYAKPSRFMRPTVRDVAARGVVSTATTVSRVLNRVGSVNVTLAERVRAACAALRHRPNHAARALSCGRSAHHVQRGDSMWPRPCGRAAHSRDDGSRASPVGMSGAEVAPAAARTRG